MKKIIIADTLHAELNKDNSLFGRKSIVVFTAGSCEDILSLHTEHNVDMIITEQDLPLIGGVRLCERIRGDRRLKTVSILLICPNEGASLIRCRAAKANAVLLKPVDRVDLFARVSELLVVPQRRDLRLFLKATVRGAAGNATFDAVTHNLSVSGLLMETRQALRADDAIRCTLHLGSREVALEGTVVRASETTTGTRLCGVKFMNMNAATYVLLEHYLKETKKQ